MTRARIELRPVKWEVKDGIGIVNINTFAGNTGQATEAALTAIDKATGGHPIGYVVDLRSNPGGLLNEAVGVSDAFLERGEIVSERGRDKKDIESWYAKPGDMAHGLPVIVLVDVGSASAAEIVAGALQDHRRAVVMGERSFGKGSVQGVPEMSPNSALRLTIARYYTPSGRSVQAGGIEPDINVPQLSDPDYKSRPRVREADLRRHLLSQASVKDDVLETTTTDPRFTATAEELEKKGVKDFQLDYAIKTLKRLGPAGATVDARQVPLRRAAAMASAASPASARSSPARPGPVAGAARPGGVARRRARARNISADCTRARCVTGSAGRTAAAIVLAALAFLVPPRKPAGPIADRARGARDRHLRRDRRLPCRR